MLIIKVFVNQRQIDELHIHNITSDVSKDIHDYEICKPDLKKETTIKHRRAEGWKSLVYKVLKHLIKKENADHSIIKNEEYLKNINSIVFDDNWWK